MLRIIFRPAMRGGMAVFDDAEYCEEEVIAKYNGYPAQELGFLSHRVLNAPKGLTLDNPVVVKPVWSFEGLYNQNSSGKYQRVPLYGIGQEERALFNHVPLFFSSENYEPAVFLKNDRVYKGLQEIGFTVVDFDVEHSASNDYYVVFIQDCLGNTISVALDKYKLSRYPLDFV